MVREITGQEEPQRQQKNFVFYSGRMLLRVKQRSDGIQCTSLNAHSRVLLFFNYCMLWVTEGMHCPIDCLLYLLYCLTSVLLHSFTFWPMTVLEFVTLIPGSTICAFYYTIRNHSSDLNPSCCSHVSFLISMHQVSQI